MLKTLRYSTFKDEIQTTKIILLSIILPKPILNRRGYG